MIPLNCWKVGKIKLNCHRAPGPQPHGGPELTIAVVKLTEIGCFKTPKLLVLYRLHSPPQPQLSSSVIVLG